MVYAGFMFRFQLWCIYIWARLTELASLDIDPLKFRVFIGLLGSSLVFLIPFCLQKRWAGWTLIGIHVALEPYWLLNGTGLAEDFVWNLAITGVGAFPIYVAARLFNKVGEEFGAKYI